MVEVKGSAITARIRFVRDRFGEQAYRRLKAALPEEDRATIDARVLPHSWVPFGLFVDINEKADELFGRGDLGLCREMGRYSAEVNLPTLYRIFYRFGTPSFIIRKAARLWDVHYSSGRLEVDSEPDGVRLRIEGFATPHRAHCLSVLGWAERSAELSGADIVYSEEERCRTRGDDVCEIVARWRS